MEKDLQKVLDEIENYRAKGIDYTLSKTSDTVAKIINKPLNNKEQTLANENNKSRKKNKR